MTLVALSNGLRKLRSSYVNSRNICESEQQPTLRCRALIVQVSISSPHLASSHQTYETYDLSNHHCGMLAFIALYLTYSFFFVDLFCLQIRHICFLQLATLQLSEEYDGISNYRVVLQL